MRFIEKAQPTQKPFQLEVTFASGEVKTIDFLPYLDGEIFEPLKQLDMFKQFTIHQDLKTVVWPNGADFSPDFLYEIGS